MKIGFLHWDEDAQDFVPVSGESDPLSDLVLYFGDRPRLVAHPPYTMLGGRFPRARFVGCSTGGHFLSGVPAHQEMVAVAIRFAATRFRIASVAVEGAEGSRAAGEELGWQLRGDDLSGVLLFSDGLNVNGSGLIAGLSSVIGAGVPVVGGLAGDGPHFGTTVVGVDAVLDAKRVAAIGLYGAAIRFGHGSDSGFTTFGPRRRITRSAGNVLYELDGKPALELYKRYLGEEAEALPGSALHFPLLVWDPAEPAASVVRTVLSIDGEAQSMTFAGDVPQGYAAQLMRSTLERLACGAGNAAKTACGSNDGAELALLVSCVGRRLVMGQRYEAELDAVQQEFGGRVPFIGFYSYGEISPRCRLGAPLLHNETMTIAMLSEKVA